MLRILEQHIGDVVQALVTGVREFGIFLRLEGYFVEGMIHVKELGRDYFEYDPDNMALVGSRTRRRLALGQAVEVRILDCQAATQLLRLGLQ